MVLALATLFAVLARPSVVTGVVTVDGKPAAGVEVNFAHYQNGEGFIRQTVRSGADGKYSITIPEDVYPGVWATKMGRGMALGRVVPGQSCDLALPPEAAFSAKFLDPDRRPLASQRVVINQVVQPVGDGLAYANLGSGVALVESKTDAQGIAQFSGLAQGLLVRLDCPRSDIAVNVSQSTEVKAGVTATVELQRGFAVSGRLTRAGKPVPGVQVFAQGQTSMAGDGAKTDIEGRYRIGRLVPDAYNVMLALPPMMGADWAATAKEGVKLDAQSPSATADIQLVKGSLLKVTARGADGKPLANRHIGVHGPGRPSSTAMIYSAKTDSRGRCDIRVAPGRQQVYVAEDGLEASVTIETKEGQDVEVTLAVPPPTVSGRPTVAKLSRRSSAFSGRR